MKKLLLLFWLLAFSVTAWAQLNTGFSAPFVCTGSGYSVGYTDPTTVYQPGNIFIAELSDASGSFAAPVAIGSSASTSASGSIAVTIPAGAAVGAGYRIRVVSSAPAATGADNGSDVQVRARPVVNIQGTHPIICLGDVAPLYANGASSYSWHHNGALTGSTQVSPTVATTYQVTGTTNGCSAVASVTIDVHNVNLNVTSTATPATICPGGTTTLEMFGATAYSWHHNGSYSATITESPVVTTTYIVTAYSGYTTVGVGCSVTASVTVTVLPTTALTATATPSVICQGGSATLQVSGGNSYSWHHNGATGTTQVVSPATTTAYWVSDNTGTCPANGYVLVMVNSNPVVTGTANPATVCPGQTVSLTASGGSTYTWGHNGAQSAVTTANPTATTSYQVTGIMNGCQATIWIPVTVAPALPVTVTANPATICMGGTVLLSASGATNYSWHHNGISIGGGSITETPTATATYTVTGSGGSGCAGTATISVLVEPSIDHSGIGSNSPVCQGGQLQLYSGVNNPQASFAWSGPNNFSSTDANPAIPAVTTAHGGVYTVTVSAPNCGSATGTTTVVIGTGTAPAAPVAGSNSPICAGQTLQLQASTIAGATYSWTGPAGFSSTQQNPAIVNATTAMAGIYTVYAATGGCASPPATVTVQVSPQQNAGFSYSSIVFCQTVANPVPATAPGVTGTFTGTAGVVVNSLTGEINLAASALGLHTITFTTSGTCAGTSSVTIRISPASAAFQYSGPYCQSGTAVPVFAPGSGPGVFSVTPAGVFVNSTTGVANLSAATPGTYTVTNTIASQGGCPAIASTASLQVMASVTATATSNSPLCAGSSLILSATGPAGATYSWSGPNGFQSAQPNNVLPNITAAMAGLYVLTTTYGGCTPHVSAIQVVVHPSLTVQASSNSPLNEGGTLLLHGSSNINGAPSWSGPNGFTATGYSPYIQNVSVAHSGTYTASVQTAACGTATATTVVQINPMNRISGRVFLDANGNGVQDAGELPIPQTLLQLSNGYSTLSNSQGDYTLMAPAGSFSVTIAGLAVYQVAAPASYVVNLSGNSAHVTGRNFAVTEPNIVRDLSIAITEVWNASPGFNTRLRLTCRNMGNYPLNGTVRFRPDPLLVFQSAFPNYNTMWGDTMIFSFPTLQPGQSHIVTVNLRVPVGTPLGTYVNSIAWARPVANDATPGNNAFTLEQMVIGSWDPNDKLVQPIGGLTLQQVQAQHPLVYTIRFQNTGTAPAVNILLADTLSAHLNLASFEMLGSSHPYQLSMREQGILEWRFPNIMLPDSNANEPASHGHVQYRIRPKTTTPLGTIIENTAHIFFDFNEAVVTNTTQTSIILVSAPATVEEAQLQVYPNPTSGTLLLQLPEGSGAVQVRLCNLLGQEVLRQMQEHSSGTWEQQLDLSRQPAGVYLLQVQQGSKSYSRKVVVQR